MRCIWRVMPFSFTIRKKTQRKRASCFFLALLFVFSMVVAPALHTSEHIAHEFADLLKSVSLHSGCNPVYADPADSGNACSECDDDCQICNLMVKSMTLAEGGSFIIDRSCCELVDDYFIQGAFRAPIRFSSRDPPCLLVG